MTRLAEDRTVLGSGLPTAGSAAVAPGADRVDEHPYGVSVHEALALPALAGARVLAGALGLHRHVLRLGVWETPDILPFTREDELLVTTGYPLLERPEQLAARFAELADRGVVAVAVKLGAYVRELPGDVLAVADRLALPVLALTPEVSLDDVINQVLSAVLGRQAALLERSEEIHRALLQVVLSGGGLPEVAQAMADGLEVSVAVTDTDGRVAASAGPDAEAVAAAALSTVLTGGSSAAARAGLVVVPIVAGGAGHGRVHAASARGRIGPQDVHALERAAVVCALVTVKQLAVSAVEERYQADFLRDVLLGRVEDPVQAVRHAASLGWQLDRPVVVVVAQPDVQPVGRSASAAASPEPVTERMSGTWRTLLRARDEGVAVCGFASEVVAIVGVPADGDVERLVREVTGSVREPNQAKATRRSFTTGVSRVVHGVAALASAYDQARTCVRVSRQLHGPGGVAHFDRLGVHRLLSLIPDSDELRAFLEETLGELARPSAQARDLRRTLEVLLDTNLNVAETARRLHFHYNTLRYRIGKLERILGPFTEDADLRLDLALALRIVPMRGLG